jgi:hypothetical protein
VKIIATYNFLFGHGNNCEVIRRGDEFEPPGTGPMNREEHARSMIKRRAAVTPEVWEKMQKKAARA